MRVLCYTLDSGRNELEVPSDGTVLLVDLPPGKRCPELWLRGGEAAATTRRVYWVLAPNEPPPSPTYKHVGTTMALANKSLDIRHVYEEGQG